MTLSPYHRQSLSVVSYAFFGVFYVNPWAITSLFSSLALTLFHSGSELRDNSNIYSTLTMYRLCNKCYAFNMHPMNTYIIYLWSLTC